MLNGFLAADKRMLWARWVSTEVGVAWPAAATGMATHVWRGLLTCTCESDKLAKAVMLLTLIVTPYVFMREATGSLSLSMSNMHFIIALAFGYLGYLGRKLRFLRSKAERQGKVEHGNK